MLTVRTRLGPSLIHGLGVFAAEPIQEGQEIWAFTPGLDISVPVDTVKGLREMAKEHLLHYGYIEPKNPDFLVLCVDDARYMNHSSAPNTINGPGYNTVAARFIDDGEELTCDYSTFDRERKLL